MLGFIGYFLLLVVVCLVGAYLYIEAQRKKAIAEQKRAISLRVTKLKSTYKQTLLGFVEEQIITIPQHDVLYRIANNFFIFQPINDQSINNCEFTLNNITGALYNIKPSMPHYPEIQEQVTAFVAQLPLQARDFNPNFYKVTLPKLVNKFVELKEEINNVDTDINILEQDIDMDDTKDVKTIIKESVEAEPSAQ